MLNVDVVGRGVIGCYRSTKKIKISYQINMTFEAFEFPDSPIRDTIFKTANEGIKDATNCKRVTLETIHINNDLYYRNQTFANLLN